MTEPSIVITGLSVRLPGADNQEEFWDLLRNGVDRTGPVSPKRRRLAKAPAWDDTIGEVDDIDLFDGEFFGIDDDEARFMDPQHRIVMELAYDAMCDAGLLESNQTKERRYSVYVAISTDSYYPLVCRYMDERGDADVHPRTIMNCHSTALPARLSHEYNLTGPVMAVDTACSSFLTALAQAADSIRIQGCDGAVVAGVNILNSSYTTRLCNAGGITTSHPFTRVFDEEADGTLIGEGAIVCVLEREDIARQRNRKIYGRVLGYAINNDGSSLNIMAPNPRGQANVIRDAYDDGIDHTRIGYIETHGTGTRIGDPIELNGLSKVYKKDDFGDKKVGIGSVKTNIGHLLSAAGGAGLTKLLLSMRHGQMVPNLHLEKPNPLMQLEDTPFEVVTEPRPWPTDGDEPRVGAITSLGLGGTNVHFVIAEGDKERPGPELTTPLLCFSAKSEDALRRMIDDVAEYASDKDCDRYNLAMTLARFRPAYEWRATARLGPGGELTDVRVADVGRKVKRILLRSTPETTAREEFFRAALAGRVRIDDAVVGRSELAISVGAVDGEDETVDIDPTLSPMEIAAELFMRGCPINWEYYFPNETGTVLTLAPYPFSKKPHWLEF